MSLTLTHFQEMANTGQQILVPRAIPAHYLTGLLSAIQGLSWRAKSGAGLQKLTGSQSAILIFKNSKRCKLSMHAPQTPCAFSLPGSMPHLVRQRWNTPFPATGKPLGEEFAMPLGQDLGWLRHRDPEVAPKTRVDARPVWGHFRVSITLLTLLACPLHGGWSPGLVTTLERSRLLILCRNT